jgi:choline dehydrogenase-like flavoprotein
VLAEAGHSVLVIERGDALHGDDIPRDHLRNHRFGPNGHSTGPEREGNPRVVVHARDGSERRVQPQQALWQNNAMTVGGGTRVFGAQAWRFAPEDFRMASIYGVPEGSSLADWPFAYEELEPHYARAEREIGVAGAPQSGLPAVQASALGRRLAQGAEALGWRTRPVPLAINTRPAAGRPACVECGTCVGFACPVDAKNGSHNTVLRRALASGRAQLLTRAQVARIEIVGGRARGVEIRLEGRTDPLRIGAGQVVLCAGAIESARLLLLSGLQSPALGRNLQGHVYTGAHARFDDVVQDGRGPGPCIATCEHNHANPGLIGGGMLANEFVMLPVHFWQTARPPQVPAWGIENKRWMAEGYRRQGMVMGPTHEIPNPDARVTLDPQVRDRHGLPVARLSGCVHRETLRSAAYLRARADEWLRASGAKETWGFVAANAHTLPGGQHQAGTCRMGRDPLTSVTDPDGRVHGHSNLWVADGSLHVTNGGFNPVLTIWALAFRVAERVSAAL